MQISRSMYFLAGVLVTLISVDLFRVVNAQSSGQRKTSGSVRLSPEDYIEIEQLYGMYARDNDPGSLRDASWMFTKDGIWCSVPSDKGSCEPVGMMAGSPFHGTDELRKFFGGIRERQSRGGVRHFSSSYVIVGTPDGGARGSAYMLTIQRREKDGRSEIANWGKYEDKLVKTPDGWRIKERVWHDDSWMGSNIPMEPSPIPGDARTEQTGAVLRAGATR